jgi:hypothetical protein
MSDVVRTARRIGSVPPYPLDDMVEAHRYVDTQQKVGTSC